MTDKTEQTKHRMYIELESLKFFTAGTAYYVPVAALEEFLEAHLEELRKDLNFACAQIDLKDAQRRKLLTERDDIQLRLHAIDHAYAVQSEANHAAGDELRHCQEVIAKQRLAIEALTGLLETRKDEVATLAQDSSGKAYIDDKRRLSAISFDDMGQCCTNQQIYRDGCGDLHCRSCKS